MRTVLPALCGTLLVITVGSVRGADLQGDYVEARTADVFTGPCISNAEVFITGSQAVLAWKVNQGTWKGTDLSGLCVAAAVRGTTTFSEDQPEKAAAVVIVDEKATPAQRDALVQLAQEMGGARLNHLVAVRTADEPEARGPPCLRGRPVACSARHAPCAAGFFLGIGTGQHRHPPPR